LRPGVAVAQVGVGAADWLSAHEWSAVGCGAYRAPALWKHLGCQFGEQAPDLASLRVMYRRRRTLFDHQELACEVLAFIPG